MILVLKEVTGGDAEVGIDDNTVASLFGGILGSTPLYSSFLSEELITNLDTFGNASGIEKVPSIHEEQSPLISSFVDDVQQMPVAKLSNDSTINDIITMRQDDNMQSEGNQVLHNSVVVNKAETDNDADINNNNDNNNNDNNHDNDDDTNAVQKKSDCYPKFDMISINHSAAGNDPFISYVDESNDSSNTSQHLLSPTFTTIHVCCPRMILISESVILVLACLPLYLLKINMFLFDFVMLEHGKQ